MLVQYYGYTISKASIRSDVGNLVDNSATIFLAATIPCKQCK
jgi:hypothetical protein